METITFDTTQLRPIGTLFTLPGKVNRKAEVIGFHVEFDSDTNETRVTYRVRYTFAGQTMTSEVPRATVERGVAR